MGEVGKTLALVLKKKKVSKCFFITNIPLLN